MVSMQRVASCCTMNRRDQVNSFRVAYEDHGGRVTDPSILLRPQIWNPNWLLRKVAGQGSKVEMGEYSQYSMNNEQSNEYNLYNYSTTYTAPSRLKNPGTTRHILTTPFQQWEPDSDPLSAPS